MTSPSAQPNGDVNVKATDIDRTISGARLTVEDTTDPDVVISGGPDCVEHQGAIEVTIAYSESVIGFVAADPVVTNASVTGLAGDGASYTATISLAGTGVVSISRPAGGTEVAGPVLPAYAGWRPKVNLGLNYVSDNNETLTVSTFLGGLGQ